MVGDLAPADKPLPYVKQTQHLLVAPIITVDMFNSACAHLAGFTQQAGALLRYRDGTAPVPRTTPQAAPSVAGQAHPLLPVGRDPAAWRSAPGTAPIRAATQEGGPVPQLPLFAPAAVDAGQAGGSLPVARGCSVGTPTSTARQAPTLLGTPVVPVSRVQPSLYLNRPATMAMVEVVQAIYKWPTLHSWRVGVFEYFDMFERACWTRQALISAFTYNMVSPDLPPGSLLNSCKAGVERLVGCLWDEARAVQLRHCWEHDEQARGRDDALHMQSHPCFG